MSAEQVGAWFSLGLVLVLGVLLFVVRRSRGAGNDDASKYSLSGIGGWLAFFLFSCFLLSPVVGVARLLKDLATAELKNPALSQHHGYLQYKVFCWCLLAAVLAWQIWMANRLRTRFEAASVVHAKRFLVFSPFVMYLGDVLAAWAFLDVNAAGEGLETSVRGLLVSLAWFLYFSSSRRVANTYLDRATPASEPLPSRRRDPYLDAPSAERAEPSMGAEPLDAEDPPVWWYADGERRNGPVAAAHLKDLVARGVVTPTSMVWRDGRLAWQPFHAVAELSSTPGTAGADKVPRRGGAAVEPWMWLLVLAAAAALVWCVLTFHLPTRPTVMEGLFMVGGALLLPGLAVVLYSLGASYPSERRTLGVFGAGCVLLVALSIGSVLFSRGYVQRFFNRDGMTAEDFRAQASRCVQLGDLKCQEISWRDYSRVRPDDPEGAARLGIVLNRRGKHQEAVDEIGRAVTLGAGSYDLFAYYADSHEKLGHLDEAIEWSYKSLSVAPDLVDVRGRLAQWLVKAKRPYEALSLLQSFDDRMTARGTTPYFAGQRISIETAISRAEGEKSSERSVLRLPVFKDHFFAPVTIGASKPRAFMVDTGASRTSLSEAMLAESKVAYRVTDPQLKMRTADGRVVSARGIVLDALKVGPFELRNVPAIACGECIPLLGQASLSQFDMQSVRTQGVDFLLLARRGSQ